MAYSARERVIGAPKHVTWLGLIPARNRRCAWTHGLAGPAGPITLRDKLSCDGLPQALRLTGPGLLICTTCPAASLARRWFQQAVATGETEAAPKAMINLGRLEMRQGNPDQARQWYQQVIDTGQIEAAGRAQQELRALDQRQDERRRGEQFGRYGYLAYADPASMKPGPPPTTADPDQAVDGDKGAVLQTAREQALTCADTVNLGCFAMYSAYSPAVGPRQDHLSSLVNSLCQVHPNSRRHLPLRANGC
jgi:TPR repeat protein